MTTTLTGPLGARSRLTVALSVAAPINSDNIGQNQYVAYSRHSVSGWPVSLRASSASINTSLMLRLAVVSFWPQPENCF